MKIVEADPTEKGDRKKLNFGHTIGHAIESYCWENEKPMDHGLAVIHGILAESKISLYKNLITEAEYKEIEEICQQYELRTFSKKECEELLLFTKNDKKNEAGKVNYTLLTGIGTSVINQEVEEGIIEKSLEIFEAN